MLLFSTILDTTAEFTPASFVDLLIEWNNAFRDGPFPENYIRGIDWDRKTWNTVFADGNLSLALAATPDLAQVGARYQKKTADGTDWTTDYVADFTRHRLTIRLDRTYSSDDYHNYFFSTPAFISNLIGHGYLVNDGELTFSEKPLLINKDNVGLLKRVILQEAGCRLPVIYISLYHHHTLVDPQTIAHRVRGVAHVLVQEDGMDNWLAIKGQCDNRHAYNGAAIIYYPRATDNRHLYLCNQNLEEGGYDDEQQSKIIRDVIYNATSRHVDTLCTWTGLQTYLMQHRIEQNQKEAKAALATNEQLRQDMKDNNSITDSLLDESARQLEALQDRVKALEDENQRLLADNCRLQEKVNAPGQMLLHTGRERDFYPGEIKDMVLSEIEKTAGSWEEGKEHTRREDVLHDVLCANNYQGLGKARTAELKRIMLQQKNTNEHMLSDLEKLGICEDTNNRHHRVSYYHDSRYHETLCSTPGDTRSNKNAVSQMTRKFF